MAGVARFFFPTFKPSKVSMRLFYPQLGDGDPGRSYPINALDATLMDLPASVANKRLTASLNSLDATLTKNRGGTSFKPKAYLSSEALFVRPLPRYLFTSLPRAPLLAWADAGPAGEEGGAVDE